MDYEGMIELLLKERMRVLAAIVHYERIQAREAASVLRCGPQVSMKTLPRATRRRAEPVH